MAFNTPISELVERNPNGLLSKHPDWERVRLGDVVTVQNGAAFKSEHFNTEGRGIPLLRIRDIVRGATETWYDGPYEEAYVVQPGDLLIGMDGEFNHARWSGPPALLNQRVCRLNFHGDRLRSDWVVHVLGGYLAAVNEATPSVTVKHLSSRTVADLPLPCPPLNVQERIVREVDRSMDRIEAGLASFALAAQGRENFRRSVLEEALPNCVIRRPRDGSRAVGDLPIGWEWSTVADEGVVQLGRMLNKERASGPHMRPYLRVANVHDDRLDLTDVKSMDFPPSEYERYRLETGDILLNEGQSPELLGRPAMYRGEMPGVCFQKTLLRFRAGARVSNEFALLVFMHYLYAGRFRRESNITIGLGHLTAVRFAAMEFPVPPLSTQHEIVARVRQQLHAADAIADTFATVQSETERLRQALLHAAVEGRLTASAVRTNSRGETHHVLASSGSTS